MPHQPKIAKNTTNVEGKTKTPEAQEVAESILKLIPKESLKAIMTQTDGDGWNALMLAVRNHPDAVEAILKAIPKESLTAFLTNNYYSGANALMFAIRFHPASVDAILNYIPEESLAAIMTQTNGNGYNALMLAAREHPSVAEPILKSIPKESLAAVLAQTNFNGYNALMLADNYHPKAIASILNAMPLEWLIATPPERLKEIVSPISSKSAFFDFVESKNNIELFVLYLAIAPEQFRKKIMANPEGRDFKTEDYNNLVLGINKLPQSYKMELSKVKNLPELLAHRLGNTTSSNTKKLPEFMEVKIILELALLTEKLKLFETLPEADKEGSRFKVAQSLCEKLNAHFKTYLHSPQKKPDTDSLMRGFVDALSEKKNEILFTHRNSFWSLCQKIAHFILKLVGTKVTSLNQLPFKTDTANIKNRLLQLTKENPLSTPDNQQESMQDTSRLKPG